MRLLGRVDLGRPRRRVAPDPVPFQQPVGLARHVHGLGRRQLHARRQLVAPDARVQPGVALARGRMTSVQSRHQPMPLLLAAARHVPARLAREQVRNRGLAARIQDRPSMLAREERSVPVLGAIRRKPAVVRQHDERREVLVKGPQAIRHPRAHAGKPGQLKPRRLKVRGLAVDPGLAHQVVDEGDVVHDAPEVRHDVAQRLPGLPMRTERPHRLEPRAQPVLEGLHRLPEVAGLPVALHQLGLVVEQVDVAGRARHEQLNHAARPRPMVRAARRQRPGGRPLRQEALARQQAGQGDPAQPAAGAPQEVAAGERLLARNRMMER